MLSQTEMFRGFDYTSSGVQYLYSVIGKPILRILFTSGLYNWFIKINQFNNFLGTSLKIYYIIDLNSIYRYGMYNLYLFQFYKEIFFFLYHSILHTWGLTLEIASFATEYFAI